MTLPKGEKGRNNKNNKHLRNSIASHFEIIYNFDNQKREKKSIECDLHCDAVDLTMKNFQKEKKNVHNAHEQRTYEHPNNIYTN